MKKLSLMASVVVLMAGCTHQKVDVTQIDDSRKSCGQIETELSQLDDMENDIDEKTGLSGRNVGMALLFWPGILVNEMNASDAEDRIRQRKERLVALYEDKNCS